MKIGRKQNKRLPSHYGLGQPTCWHNKINYTQIWILAPKIQVIGNQPQLARKCGLENESYKSCLLSVFWDDNQLRKNTGHSIRLTWPPLCWTKKKESSPSAVEEELLIRVVFWLLELHYNGCLPVKMDFTRFSSATLWNVVTWVTISKRLFLRSFNGLFSNFHYALCCQMIELNLN